MTSNHARRSRLPLLSFLTLLPACSSADLTIASKSFTESIILGEIVAQHLESKGLTVDRKLNLGGTFICHQALINGQADVYVEYTGTAHAAILELPTERDQAVVRQQLDSIYRVNWDLEWTEPLGFNNTFAMLVRGADARERNLRSYSDLSALAHVWKPGFGYEFVERADGYPGLTETYGFRFVAAPAVMDLGLTYRALADGQVDVIAGNSTDGQIEALDLVHLRDDLEYFPRYDAAPVVRRAALDEHPAIRAALLELGGTIDDATMRRLNFLVDAERQPIREVAAQFLATLDGSNLVPNR